MKLLFAIPYYNNSHFLDIQIYSFRKYLKNCDWKVIVIDDSMPTTKNVLSGLPENIEKECSKYKDEVLYYRFDQTKHFSNEADKRHYNILNTAIINDIWTTYKNEYDYVGIFDADMCLLSDYDPNIEFLSEGYLCDIIGTKRIQWLSNTQVVNTDKFVFLFVHCCFWNMKTIHNYRELNLGVIPNTTCDTGSMMLEFFHNNPQYKIKYFSEQTGQQYQSLSFFEFYHDRKFIHFSTGSLWYYSNERFSKNTYVETFKQFKKYVEYGLSETDRENIIKEDNEKFNKKWHDTENLGFLYKPDISLSFPPNTFF